ncbi:uncharacterized protein LOC120357030 isoform X3 [Solenopsis invicta]|uniref:uncharacterized protein LOC120357030 isoform X3 n=1 Tax=Solenopsis invicta TaxID=13686 RepID=UPI00193E7CDD|nr:uncharacterized protein LOC120357030 isoform X3 [Solenopsis invicta]
MHAAVICFRVETSERAVAATAAAVVVTVASSSSSSSPPLPLPRARAFPCAGVRAEALRSTGCSDSDGCSTRRDASQCAVAFFPTINGVASNPGTAGAFDFFTRLTSRCLPECGESRPNVGFRRVASRQERSTGSLEENLFDATFQIFRSHESILIRFARSQSSPPMLENASLQRGTRGA